jgi:Flp pilus assembly protein TadD
LVHYHLGMTYLATGQHEKASEQFKKAQNLAPNDTELKKKIDAALSEKEKG